MPKHLMVTYHDALIVAPILLSHPLVSAVQLFGSVARNRQGNDLDLILIVPEEIAKAFYSETRERHLKRRLVFFTWGSSPARFRAARKVLGLEFEILLREIRMQYPHLHLDLFLFPSGWKERIEELESEIYHRDLGFTARIAEYAVEIA